MFCVLLHRWCSSPARSPSVAVFFFIAPPSVLLQPNRLPSVSSFFLQIFCGFFSSSLDLLWVSISLESQIFIVFFKFIFFFYGTQVFKTRVPCGKNVSMSTIDLEAWRLDFFIELNFQRLEMLVCSILPHPCQLIIFFPSLMLSCKFPLE